MPEMLTTIDTIEIIFTIWVYPSFGIKKCFLFAAYTEKKNSLGEKITNQNQNSKETKGQNYLNYLFTIQVQSN